ncbi:MAG: hypothetical protein QOG69_1672 [Actinomycetota bacterium]|nr:hypothetical protein [Actinomycetota bacterium]
MTINDSAIRTSNLSPSGPSVQARARDGAHTFRDHEGIPSPERRKGFVITHKEGWYRAGGRHGEARRLHQAGGQLGDG